MQQPQDHPFFAFCFFQSGRGRLTVDGRSRLVPAHTVSLIPAHCKHQLAADSGWACGLQVLQFETEWLAEVAEPAILASLDRLTKAAIEPIPLRGAAGRQITAQLVAASQASTRRDASACRAIVTDLCYRLAQLVASTPAPALVEHRSARSAAPISTQGRPELDRVLQFIENNLSKPISRQELARQAAFAPSYFSALFREATGTTIPEYINIRRVHRAKELLRQPETRVSTVCYAVGFRDLSNFNRVFKRVVGCTPREFREAELNANNQ